MINICEDANDIYVRMYGLLTPGGKLIMYGREVAGMIDFDVYDDYVKINYITVHDEYRRQGIATNVIKQIIEDNKGKYLYGDALPEALSFWEHLGAEFDEDPDPDEDYLTPFHINC